MQVPGDPEPLVLGGETCELGSRVRKRSIALEYLEDAEGHERDDQDRDRGDAVERGRDRVVPGGDHGRHEQRGQRQRENDRGRADAEQGHRHGREVQAHDERRVAGERHLRHEQRGENGVERPQPAWARLAARPHEGDIAGCERSKDRVTDHAIRAVRVFRHRWDDVQQVDEEDAGQHQPAPALRPPALTLNPFGSGPVGRLDIAVHVRRM